MTLLLGRKRFYESWQGQHLALSEKSCDEICQTFLKGFSLCSTGEEGQNLVSMAMKGRSGHLLSEKTLAAESRKIRILL